MAEPQNRWTPKQLHKMMTLITGIALIATGVILLCNNVGAQGSVDIKTTFVTGKITSGSAGLFCFFFGLILIIMGNTFPKPNESNSVLKEKKVVALMVSGAMILILVVIYACLPQTQVLVLPIIGLTLLPFGKLLIELK